MRGDNLGQEVAGVSRPRLEGGPSMERSMAERR